MVCLLFFFSSHVFTALIIALAIQYSNYTGRVTGAVWGGSGVHVGMLGYVGLEIALIGIGGVMFMTLWRELKAKTG